jgi:hypothetical protein
MAEQESPGAALVRFRWAKTTRAERVAVAMALVKARRAKAAARKADGTGKEESKRAARKARKSAR